MSEIWKALLEVQKEAPALHRSGLNPHFKSEYVTLEVVMTTVLPILNKHGVVLVQCTDADDNLVTRLVHAGMADEGFKSESEVVSVMKLRVAKDDPQGYGSAMTYARRYALMGMLGLVADADDDGNAAALAVQKAAGGNPGRAPKAKPEPTEVFPQNWTQLKTQFEAFGEGWWNDWLMFGKQAKDTLFGPGEEPLTADQRQALWEVTLAASQWLLLRNDPDKFPPPDVEEMRKAWGFALGTGQELAGPG